MSGRVGSITTDIIADGLVFNMDPANRASTIPSTSTTICKDTINLSVSGSFLGGCEFSSENNGVWTFDGVDEDSIKLNDTLDHLPLGDNARTMCAWAKPNSTGWGSVERGMLQYGNFGTAQLSLISLTNLGYFHFKGYNRDVNFSLTDYRDNQWHYFVAAYEGSRIIHGYVDGNFISTKTIPTNILATISGDENFIGDYYDLGDNSWNGLIGNCHIYNRALSANEVLHNYNALKGRFGL